MHGQKAILTKNKPPPPQAGKCFEGTETTTYSGVYHLERNWRSSNALVNVSIDFMQGCFRVFSSQDPL